MGAVVRIPNILGDSFGTDHNLLPDTELPDVRSRNPQWNRNNYPRVSVGLYPRGGSRE